MEAENFLANGFATRVAIESKNNGWTPLQNIAHTWQPTRLKGIQVNPEFGTPFLAATQVYDLRPVPRKWLSLHRTGDYAERFVYDGTILLTCSGSVGRATLAHSTIDGILISHDLLRVNAHKPDWWGWIYAYLRTPTVREMMKAERYGHIIQHLETCHLDELPVLRLREDLRSAFDNKAKRIIAARDKAHQLVNQAEDDYQSAIGPVPKLDQGTSGFVTAANAMVGGERRLEGSYHNPVARAAEQAVLEAADRIDRVDNLVERVFVPGRFKHVYGDEGTPYLDSAQILEVAPEVDKYVLSLVGEKQAGYLVEKGTLLIPCSGQLHGIIGNVVLATDWHEDKVLTNHILRIVPKSNSTIRVGYLQAVLGHPLFGRPRVLKGAFGSSVPELSVEHVSRLSIPRLRQSTEDKIADAMEAATELRADADSIEEQISAEAEEYVIRFLSGGQEHLEPDSILR